LNILCNSIWTSYAFKTQNIDLAIICVIPLVITVILTTIYLSVIPKTEHIQRFFATVLISQIFNFDLLPMSLCGTLGTLTSILTSGISLTYLPEIIKTRDVSGINLLLTSMSVLNYIIWTLYACVKNDPFMTISQGLGFFFNMIMVMFYYWANGKIT
jgi:uncharacterized protein with PQ loop repeat